MLDPISSSIGEFPYHNTAIPALILRLLNTLCQSGGRNESVASVTGSSGLSDDKLGKRDATATSNLEKCRLWPSIRGGLEETVAAGVFGCTLVVELNIIPINQISDLVVDRAVGTSAKFVGREPWCNGSMGEDEATLWELVTKLPREVDEPLFGSPIACIDCIEVFIINVDTVQVEVLHKGCHSVGGGDRIGSSGSWGIGRTEERNDD